MKRIGSLIFTASALAACDQVSTKSDLGASPGPVEMVGNESLGASYCLTSADGDPREQIRGLAANKWDAEEFSKESGSFSSCDIGPMRALGPENDCPKPPSVILADNDRLRIHSDGLTGGGDPRFQITLLPNGHLVCGNHTNLSFEAHGVADELSSGAEKWLVSNAAVLCENNYYWIYTYFVDVPQTAASHSQGQIEQIPKHYRIEFFNEKSNRCMANAGNTRRPPSSGVCRAVEKEQEPVGDGRQHAAVRQACTYSGIQPGG